MDTPFFSIVIPTFNSSSTLSFALESIVDQVYKNFEVLVMDGNSEDNTVQIAKDFNDARIKIISEPDNGIYDAMNKGVALAKGEWLYFLGSDDKFYSNDVLGKVVSSFRPELEVVYGNVCRIKYMSFYDGLFDENKILKRNICHQAIFIKKTLFIRIGNFNVHYKATADWDHNMRWLLSPGIQHLFINEVIANYAEGGFSSKFIDVAFEKDKMVNYLRYSKRKLALRKKLYLIKQELIKQVKNRNSKQVFRLFYYLPDILLTNSR